ncbi:uncharacterized protein LOC111319932 [Stylophora pistillata]|uniref:uncharacterized protein LOC111319932 n=1 Tax=Stylophora pistillata TaxID=50429 RepID=UPI000C045C30|nr:uncharacterized protein LOC111319932 [Stylophora pistillata]
MAKYIFVTGGVMSSLGKGIAASGIGALLQSRGYKVRIRKFDPYLNVDPGTMNPQQHGEVFVTEDGAETDLDLGHYERFIGRSGLSSDAVTVGRVYSDVIAKERHGDYLGATVQVIPHITDRIKELISADVSEDIDFVICEAGGTVGDIEGLALIEAMRQFSNKVGPKKSMHIHLTYLPYVPSAQELKTKPSQHAVKELLHVGIQPDILLCRCDRPIPEDARRKLALFCNVEPKNVLDALDVESIYEVPLRYRDNQFDLRVLEHFEMKPQAAPDMSPWENFIEREKKPLHETTIALVGKYISLRDAYKSILEAFTRDKVGIWEKISFTRRPSGADFKRR